MLGFIRNSGVEPHIIEYLKTFPTRVLLRQVAARMGIPVAFASKKYLRAIVTSGRFPYVDGPLLARLFGQCSDQIACVHMSGLCFGART